MATRADLALAGILVLHVALALACALRFELGFDETMHVWMAHASPLSQVVRELRLEAHPPLHHIVLRALTSPDSAAAWLRLPTIAGSALALLGLHRVAVEAGVSRGVALAVTLMGAISWTNLNLAACVRAYTLAAGFTWLALVPWMQILRDPGRAPRALPWLLLWGTLAVCTEYSAGLVLAVCGAALAVLAPRDPAPWSALVAACRMRWRLLVPLLPVAILGGLYLRATGTEFALQHLGTHVRGADQPALAFLGEAVHRQAALFTPFTSASGLAELAVTLGFTLALVAAAWRGPRAARAVALGLALLWALGAALAMARLHPFGGKARHQHHYLLLQLLALAIALHYGLPGWRGLRAGAVALVLALAGFSAATAARRGPIEEFPAAPLHGQEADALLRRVEPDTVLCLAPYDVVVVFGRTRAAHWRGAGRVAGGGGRYLVEGAPRLREVLRTPYWRISDRSVPDVAQWLGQALGELGRDSVQVGILHDAELADPQARRAAWAGSLPAGLQLAEWSVAERAELVVVRRSTIR